MSAALRGGALDDDVAGRRRSGVLGTPIDIVTPAGAIARVQAWADAGESRTVVLCNVHSVVTAQRDAMYRRCIEQADMATPDGAPVAWLMRRQGVQGQARVSGPDLMDHYMRAAAARGEPVFLLGGTPATLAALQQRLAQLHPRLRIAGAESPPFRALTADEDAALVERIHASGARTVWVGLGCPKQERWITEHRGRVRAVMLGVGAAFDFHAGTLRRAPAWMQRSGLEWLHRLSQEPRRLGPRYLDTNARFVWGVARQWLSRGRTS